MGQASAKNKGKISRSLAAKASLATRVDAFGEEANFDLGTDHRARLETRLRILEDGNLKKLSGTGKAKAKFEKYHGKSEIKLYPTEEDSTIPIVMGKKRKLSDGKPLIEEIKSEPASDNELNASTSSGKKKKKVKQESAEDETPEVQSPKKKKVKVEDAAEPEVQSEKKKKKKRKTEEMETETVEQPAEEAEDEVPKSEKKKKKKKKKQDQDTSEDS